MKLTDQTHGLKRTPLEAVALQGGDAGRPPRLLGPVGPGRHQERHRRRHRRGRLPVLGPGRGRGAAPLRPAGRHRARYRLRHRQGGAAPGPRLPGGPRHRHLGGGGGAGPASPTSTNVHFHLGNGYDLAAFRHFSQPWFVAHPYPMNFYISQEVARLAVKAGFWLEDRKDELRVTARKTGRAGVADQVAALAALTDPAQRLARLRSATRRRRNPRGPGG